MSHATTRVAHAPNRGMCPPWARVALAMAVAVVVGRVMWCRGSVFGGVPASVRQLSGMDAL